MERVPVAWAQAPHQGRSAPGAPGPKPREAE